MNVLLWIGIVYGISILLGIGIFLYDAHKYPVCPLCGNNIVEVSGGELVCVKRIKGKIICPTCQLVVK